MNRLLLLSCAILAPVMASAQGGAPELVAAPGVQAPSLAWKRATFTLASPTLGETVRVFVATPPAYERSRHALPTLYLLDGQYYLGEVEGVLASLVANGHVPEMLLVGIESHDRRRDFTPSGIHLDDVGDRARADEYLAFLEHELAPAVEARLRAGRPRVLLGHSHAGMLVLHAVAQRPTVFPWGLALDAPTHHEDGFLGRELLRALGEEATPPVRVVSRSVVFGFSPEDWSALARAARPDDRLSQHALVGEDHESMLFLGAYEGLRELFQDASALVLRELSPLELDARCTELARLYGAALVPPEPLLRSTVDGFLLEGRGRQAGEWLERYVAAYGAPPDHAELRTRIAAATALGDPPETVAELLALPRATPAEMKDHLGTWTGHEWRDAARKNPLALRFWVEDGVVQGLLDPAMGPDIPVEYLRFGPGGTLEFGFKNGMHPRGLLVYTETTAGGALEGTMLARGIRLTLPPGEPHPPVTHFELTRQAR